MWGCILLTFMLEMPALVFLYKIYVYVYWLPRFSLIQKCDQKPLKIVAAVTLQMQTECGNIKAMLMLNNEVILYLCINVRVHACTHIKQATLRLVQLVRWSVDHRINKQTTTCDF